MDKQHDDEMHEEELHSIQEDEGSEFILRRVQSLLGERSSRQSGSDYDEPTSDHDGGQM